LSFQAAPAVEGQRMADRTDFSVRQRVTEAELDLAFSQLENADRNLAADLGIHGVVSGAVPAPHAPLADLTIDLTAPGRAYDNLGQRVFFGTGQTVNCAVDLTGIPTDVSSAGNARWVAVLSPLAASAATFDAHGGAATPAANSPAPATREPLARPFPAHRDRDTSRHAGRGLTATNRRDPRRGSTVTAPRTPPRSGPGGSR
jgi:hypothetical protein